MTTARLVYVVAVAALSAISVAAFAQSPPAPGQAAPSTTPPSAGLGAPPGAGTGVIQPPMQVDPGIKKAAPTAQAFPMPVVPPPGTAGGDPNVVAK